MKNGFLARLVARSRNDYVSAEDKRSTRILAGFIAITCCAVSGVIGLVSRSFKVYWIAVATSAAMILLLGVVLSIVGVVWRRNSRRT